MPPSPNKQAGEKIRQATSKVASVADPNKGRTGQRRMRTACDMNVSPNIARVRQSQDCKRFIKFKTAHMQTDFAFYDGRNAFPEINALGEINLAKVGKEQKHEIDVPTYQQRKQKIPCSGRRENGI
ncbi:hypothetical protein CEXT_96631 [Caerostris extrusa]|uniref:Uncharacterized protein n=1 Tax=Caerostris extrusa TaxID=172846 RepID=A0AAV4RN10_CAEEX|nr:hypothetical protein CEXT_96631 [Caerostris extrusa]